MTTLFIDWQPQAELFSVGEYALRWYSLLWFVGLTLALVIVMRLYKQLHIDDEKFEPLFPYCFVGIVAGARLGHCLFYQPDYYLTSIKGIVEMILPIHQEFDGSWTFSGYEGLASHGGTIGIILALMLYWRRVGVDKWIVLDIIAIAVPITACCIRLGNLMNSEIIGNPTDVAWAFVFHTPDAMIDGHLVPRHPAQLYEAIFYFVIFIVGLLIYSHWRNTQSMSDKTSIAIGTGFYFGLCLTAIFTFRFLVEFIKKEQVDFEQGMLFDMGQMLSLPFVAIGIYCLIRAKRLHNKIDCCV